MDVERFSDWVDDLEILRRQAESDYGQIPIILLGQGVGAQTSLAYSLDHPDRISGVILSAPFFATTKVAKPARSALRFAARLSPGLRVGVGDLSTISKDPSVVAAYKSDPLVHHGNPTLRYAAIVESQFRALPERARDLRIPILIQHGMDDTISAPEGTEFLASCCGARNQTVLLYEDLGHHIFQEEDGDVPLHDLREWLAERR